VRVFVTGWNGLLGNALLPRLRAAHEVDGFGIEDGDVTDPDYVRKRLDPFHPEAVLHLAALVKMWVPEPERFEQVNLGGFRNALSAARAAGARLVYTSSFMAVGPAGPPPAGESQVQPGTLRSTQ
jgi:nucleoside-diphosphate-sugar epimerase